MRINLIKDSFVDQDVYAQVVDLLQSTPGAIQFSGAIAIEDDFVINLSKADSNEYVANYSKELPQKSIKSNIYTSKSRFSWRSLFERSNKVRVDEEIPTLDATYLITDKENELNYFSAFDPNKPTNGFIQASDWDLFIDAPAAYPIAYQVIATFLQSHMFRTMDEVQQFTHKKPIGCLNDYCEDKSQVLLKLRTADICNNCMNILKERVDKSILKHAIDLMESLRLKMKFVQNINDEQIRLKIEKKQLHFIGSFGTITIRLTPMEMAIYKLFLNFEEGIRFADLTDADKKELFLKYYQDLSPNQTQNACKELVEKYVHVYVDNSMSEKVSKIRRKIEEGLGKEQAKPFIIAGANAEPKKIEVDREYIKIS
jgi:hypothetical protein